MAGGKPSQAGCTLGGCFAASVFIIFCVAMTVSLLGGAGDSATASDTSTSTLTDKGDLTNVSEVPDKLKPIFVAAAKHSEMSPAFLAAIFWKEHGRNFPTKGPWASSNAGARGPFQFMKCTWEGWGGCSNSGAVSTDPSFIKSHGGYGLDGDGDDKADVMNLTDAAFGAAKYLSKNGAKNTTDLDKLRDTASRYNSGKPWSKGKNIPETADYVPDVIKEYQKIVGEM